MELIIVVLLLVVLLLVVLARLRPKPSAADTGFLLPAMRMSAAVLLVVLISMVVMEVLPG